MGNAIIAGAGVGAGGGGGRKAKIMKMNGEFFKLSMPAKAGSVIEDYPGHVLLDSDDFLRFNLRARPLDVEAELQPKKIYLLVELPKFPATEDDENTLQHEILNERSNRQREDFRLSQYSTSDFSVTTRSEPEDDTEGGGEGLSAAAVRVKVKLPKLQVEKILEQSRNDVEAASKIIDLCIQDGGPAAELAAEDGDRAVALDLEMGEEQQSGAEEGRWTGSGAEETTKEVSFNKYSMKFQSSYSPYTNHHSKYKKLINN